MTKQGVEEKRQKRKSSVASILREKRSMLYIPKSLTNGGLQALAVWCVGIISSPTTEVL